MWNNGRNGRRHSRGAMFDRGMGGPQAGPWPGHGPFSHLPPWERPGWLMGRGACRRFFTPGEPAKEEKERMLKEELSELEERVEQIRKRLGEPGG